MIAAEHVNTLFIAGDYNILFYPDILGIGGGIYSNTLMNSPYRTNCFFLSAAYHKKYQMHTFHLGALYAYQNIRLTVENLLFPDQYDRNTGGYSAHLSTGEYLEDDYLNFSDFNLGMAYTIQLNTLEPEVGIALIRINKPALNVSGQSEYLDMEKTFYLKTRFYYSHQFEIEPIIYFITHQNKLHKTFGTNLNYGLSRNSTIVKSLKTGLFYRHISSNYPNSVVFNIGAGHNNLHIDIYYNLYTGNIESTVPAIKILELCITWLGFNRKIEEFTMPCKIY